MPDSGLRRVVIWTTPCRDLYYNRCGNWLLRSCDTCPEGTVSGPKLDLSRLGELATGPCLYQQFCLIYATREQQFTAALPYLRACLEGRERRIYIANKNNRAAVLDALRKTGTNVDR